jgi:hypothetical protein
MLSEFRTRKLSRFFDVVDTDRDGVFTGADTEVVGQRLCALRGLEPGTPPHRTFMVGFTYYWEDVRRAIDADADGRVTRQEWLDYHERMLADRPRFLATAANSANLMFGLVDRDGDGRISTEEYAEWMRAWGMTDAARSAEVFANLDPDAAGSFSHEEVMALTEDFFYSDDPARPGNWVMGPLSSD